MVKLENELRTNFTQCTIHVPLSGDLMCSSHFSSLNQCKSLHQQQYLYKYNNETIILNVDQYTMYLQSLTAK